MRDEILEAREEHAHAFIDAGVSLYPTWHEKRQTTADIHAHFSAIQEAKSVVTVCGRVMGKREHGGSTFADIHDEQGSVQILFKEDILGAQRYTLVAALDLGDIVSVSGTGEKTRAGEETIYATQWTLLAKSRHPLPDHWAGLQDVELRARAREQDLLVNKESFATFQKRSRIVQCIREFFYEQRFFGSRNAYSSKHPRRRICTTIFNTS